MARAYAARLFLLRIFSVRNSTNAFTHGELLRRLLRQKVPRDPRLHLATAGQQQGRGAEDRLRQDMNGLRAAILECRTGSIGLVFCGNNLIVPEFYLSQGLISTSPEGLRKRQEGIHAGPEKEVEDGSIGEGSGQALDH
jgi:hypothetical protein